MRHFLSMADLDPATLHALLDLATALKAQPHQPLLSGRSIALVFEKQSLRTRLSFDVGIYQLGGHAVYLDQKQIGIGQREPVQDVARVLGRMVDAIVLRTHGHQVLEDLAQLSGVPVINALSDSEHPCQVMADLLTVREHRGALQGQTLAYIGDGNNVAASLAIGCALAGMHFVIACPDGYTIPADAWDRAEIIAHTTGGSLERVVSPYQAVSTADVLYTDVWTSMGQEAEAKQREHDFAGYCIDEALVAAAPDGVMVLHDLPAHRGEEITDGAFEAAAQWIFDQAENRLHAQKAVLAWVLGAESHEPAGRHA